MRLQLQRVQHATCCGAGHAHHVTIPILWTPFSGAVCLQPGAHLGGLSPEFPTHFLANFRCSCHAEGVCKVRLWSGLPRASRLHFIGTWKARIEALMSSMAATAPRPTVDPQGATLLQGRSADQPGRLPERAIIHLDMDCFFASVAALTDPCFKGLPLAVCHSNSARGSGEVSAANYEARAFGVSAGMFMAEAKRCCPDLIVMPYQFDRYEEISEQVS